MLPAYHSGQILLSVSQFFHWTPTVLSFLPLLLPCDESLQTHSPGQFLHLPSSGFLSAPLRPRPQPVQFLFCALPSQKPAFSQRSQLPPAPEHPDPHPASPARYGFPLSGLSAPLLSFLRFSSWLYLHHNFNFFDSICPFQSLRFDFLDHSVRKSSGTN